MYADLVKPARAPVTVPSLRQMKAEGRPIAAITCYDASFARAIDEAGLDLVLVGDSLGMVVQGQESTLPVTVEDIVYHTRCVARGLRSALLVADLPFQSYATPELALRSSTALLGRGHAAMVKLEGGAAFALEAIAFLSEREIPVCAHLGLTPQSVLKLGGYKVQGREAAAALHLREQAQAVCAAGADLLVLECVPTALAAEITRESPIPTIGIGAGGACDGQILVLYDLLGLNSGHRRPRFVKDFLAGNGSIAGALRGYADAVRSRAFPDAEHSYA
jgi:3-methyl-2-oxobutanoate hydroxymethyltransferase